MRICAICHAEHQPPSPQSGHSNIRSRTRPCLSAALQQHIAPRHHRACDAAATHNQRVVPDARVNNWNPGVGGKQMQAYTQPAGTCVTMPEAEGVREDTQLLLDV